MSDIEKGMGDIAQTLSELLAKSAGGLAENETPRVGVIKAGNVELFLDICREVGIANTEGFTEEQCRLVLKTIEDKEEDNLISAKQAHDLRTLTLGQKAMMGSPAPSDPKHPAPTQKVVLSLAEAKLAKELGYELCLCTFPPSVMLWRQPEKAHVCPACGREVSRKKKQR